MSATWEPQAGSCNEPVDIGLNMRHGYCGRPSVDGGLCNVHRAAKARGAATRERNRKAWHAARRAKS